MKIKERTYKNLFRTLFLALALFELMNILHILDFHPVYTWFGLIFTSCGALLGIETANLLMRHYQKISLPWTIWALAFASVFIDAWGDISGFYALFPNYDKITHFFGGLTTTLILFETIRLVTKRPRTDYLITALRPLLAYSLMLTFGTLYEIEEYIEDLVSGSHRSGGNADTASDLLMNTLGATIALALLYLREHSRGSRIKRALSARKSSLSGASQAVRI